MPSFPQPGSVTICEINRDLITAENLSDNQSKDTYGKILGMVFSPIPFQSDQIVSSNGMQETEEGQRPSGLLKTLQGFAYDTIGHMFRPNYVHLLPEVDFKGVDWHQHKYIIAFISGPNEVIVHDYEESGEGKDACILTCDAQRDVKVLEWRPNGGKSLSVGCKGGICIWSA